jgi:putative membrane protein
MLFEARPEFDASLLSVPDVAFAPELAFSTLAFVLGGVALGTISGLTPGLHANNFALLLASAASSISGPPALVAAAMLAAGVVHTFLDIVPALALGVPDAAMAPSALPGHRLVIAGRGREALRLSALGSGLAVALAAPLAVPITRLMTAVYGTLRSAMPVVLGVVVLLLLATESSRRRAVAGAISFVLSALLGAATLDLSPAAPLAAGGMLTPLFAGLFGAPVLIEAIGGAGVPTQDDPRLALARREVARPALAGTVSGALVGYLPGVSAGVASSLALAGLPGGRDARRFVIATSGANTATTVFALFALVALGTPRTGVMVALSESGAPIAIGPLLVTTVLAAAAGFGLVVVAGDRYLRTVGRVDPAAASVGVLCLLVALSYLFAGVVGVTTFAVAAAVGLLPARLGTRRVHLMGVLIGPIALGL